jgi:hypothetical protein
MTGSSGYDVLYLVFKKERVVFFPSQFLSLLFHVCTHWMYEEEICSS